MSSSDDDDFDATPPAGSTARALSPSAVDPALTLGNRNGGGPAERARDGGGDDDEDDEDAEGDEDEEGVVDNIEPDDDDEDDEDDDEEDEDESDNEERRKRKPKKRRLNRFLDVEAVVDDEDEEEDEEGEYAAAENDFIENDRMSPDYSRESGRHRLLDLQREGEKERSARDLAQELDERYKRSVKYQGDSNIGPSKANMPTPFDPKLWRISCKGGKERDIIRTILQKSFAMEQMGEDLGITAAFQRDTIRETIYVEARQPQDVQKALTGIAGVYLNSRPRAGPVIPGRDHVGKGPMIVPRDDMVPLLTMKKKEVEAKEGMWVRVKRGKYAGDLAQISEVVQDGLTAVVLLVPRIDYNPNDRIEDRKRKKAGLQNGPASTVRPPARLFNIEDVQNAYGKGTVSRRAGQYMFQNEDYNADGLLEKEYPLASLELENVKPTLDEISLFPKAGEGEGTGITVNLEAIREDTRKTTAQNIQPGDHVEVMEGEQSGIKGVVETVRGETVTIRAPPMTLGEKDAVLEIPVAAVQKTFKEGDHVKVMTGKNAGETGLVLDSNADTGIVAIWSDLGERKIEVFARDLREAAEVGGGANRVGDYELHDLIMIDPQTAGVIFQTERDGVKVLDQNGGVRSLKVHQISGKADSRFKPVGLDKTGREFREGDQMKELEGEGRKGQVLRIYRSIFAFLHSREITENQGVFVVRCNNLGPVDPRSDASASTSLDLSKMNPALGRPAPKSGVVMSNLRHLINTRVVITKGSYKGLIGIIKDMSGEKARVELATNNRVVDQLVTNLKRKDENGNTFALDLSRGMRVQPGSQGPVGGSMGPPTGLPPSQNPYLAAGGATPAPGMAYGMTPNPYANAGGRTPAPGYGQTPNPYANAGGRTPGYAAGGATPAGALGGRTPAAAYGGATPYAGYGSGAGGSTDYAAASGSNPYAGAGSRYGANSTYGGASTNPYTPAGMNGAGAIPFSPAAGPSWLSKQAGGATGGANPYSSTPSYGGISSTPGAFASGTPIGARGGTVAPLHENWSQGLTGIRVTLGPTLANPRAPDAPPVWENNIYANDTFILVNHAPSMLRPLMCSLQSTTRRDPSSGNYITVAVPIQYLRPESPTSGKTGEEVMVLVGDMREKRAKTTLQDRETGMWMITASPTKLFPGEHLCRTA